MEHPAAGEVSMVANPIRFSGTPIRHDHAPPLLGEHTESILRDLLGLAPARIEQLRKENVI